MEWSDLRYVLAIARAGTSSEAARRLGVNQTTVARRLKVAEAALRARLFDRVDGRFIATRRGDAVIARATAIEREVEAAAHDGDNAGVIAGRVRVTAVPILVNRLLIPAVPVLQRAHPRLEIELIAESRNLQLTRREADIALRLARPERGAALTRRVGLLDYAVYTPASVTAAKCPWITYDDSMAHLPQARWIAARGETIAPLLVNDAEALLQAVRAGLGKSLLPCFVADGDPLLRRVGPRQAVLAREIWLLVHRDLRTEARIVAVIDWLATLMPRGRLGR